MIKKITVEELTLGMYVQELHSSWMNHPFWKTSFLLEDDEDLQKIRSCGVKNVSIDLSKSVLKKAKPAEPPANKTTDSVAKPKTKPAPVKFSLQRELAKARELCDTSRSAVMNMFKEARMGATVSADVVENVVEQIANSVVRHPQALISLARLKTADNYTYLHSVAVSAMMVAFAKALGFDEEQTREAGAAGLLHDLGKSGIPDSILSKPGKLTTEEFEIIKTHSSIGAEILEATPDVNPNVIEACLHHHEKMDGSGYPHGLKGDEITRLARMTAICDVYDAVTSNRPYKQGWCPAESLQRMMQWKGHFDPALFQVFVKTLGIYPTGTLVRMESQRLAVVVEQNEGSILKPVVKVFFSLRSNLPLSPQLLDLSSSKANDKIIAREAQEDWNFKYLDELWQSEN
ncbi:MAG: HD-GYP domain-containing protein [Pseudohongiellaceae bacterium]|nr:HD-GYP domain-containing protein [Pseudohongiellaceae bacterium]